MGMLKQTNYADQKLVVGSIEILGDVTGGQILTIKRTVDALGTSVSQIAKAQQDYWTKTSSDGVISPSEKKMLKKEMETIVQTYNDISELAKERGVNQSAQFKAYSASYSALHKYITVDLALFDDMTSSTDIGNTEYFNSLYSNYYAAELTMQTVLSDTDIRILSSLEESGINGEIAIYQNAFYTYKIDGWKAMGSAGYLGAKEEVPSGVYGDYYLCTKDGISYLSIMTEEGLLTDEDGKTIEIPVTKMEAGYVYVFENKWVKIEDRNDYRYVIALTDLIENGYSPSPAIKNMVTEEAAGTVKENTPCYLGAVDDTESISSPESGARWIDFEELKTWTYSGASWVSQNIHNGDWFCWANLDRTSDKTASGTLVKGSIYQFNSSTWTVLDPSDTRNYEQHMSALKDIIEARNGENGYFNALFANVLLSDKAFISYLKASQLWAEKIQIATSGIIESDDYTEGGDKGFRISGNGDTVFNGATFRGRLETGPLYVSEEEKEVETYIKTGKLTYDIMSSMDYIRLKKSPHYSLCYISNKVKGMYKQRIGQIDFSYFEIAQTYNQGRPAILEETYDYLIFYDGNMNEVGRISRDTEYSWTADISKWYVELNVYERIELTPVVFDGSKTIRLKGLPQEDPEIEGQLYCNPEDGILRVSAGSAESSGDTSSQN